MDRQRLARYWFGGAIALAIGLLGFGAATIASAQAGNTIRACIRNGNIISIGDSSQDCPRNATALEWNKEGPAGPRGPAGPANVVVRRVEPPASAMSATADCASGEIATGGGGAVAQGGNALGHSYPTVGGGSLAFPANGQKARGWAATRVAGTIPNPWAVFVLCAPES